MLVDLRPTNACTLYIVQQLVKMEMADILCLEGQTLKTVSSNY